MEVPEEQEGPNEDSDQDEDYAYRNNHGRLKELSPWLHREPITHSWLGCVRELA